MGLQSEQILQWQGCSRVSRCSYLAAVEYNSLTTHTQSQSVYCLVRIIYPERNDLAQCSEWQSLAPTTTFLLLGFPKHIQLLSTSQIELHLRKSIGH